MKVSFPYSGFFHALIFIVSTSCVSQNNEIAAPSTSVAIGPAWKIKASMPTARMRASCDEVGGKIYVIGGQNTNSRFDTVEIYDPASDSWTIGASMNIPRSSHGHVVLNSKIYVFGGNQNGLNGKTVEVYDPTLDSWSQLNDTSSLKEGIQAQVLGGIIHLFGGNDDPSSNEQYDITTGAITASANMSSPRLFFSSAVIAGKAYMIDGTDSLTNIAETYDPITNTWVPIVAPPVNLGTHTSSAINDKLYVFGGVSTSPSLNSTYVYNTITNTWTQMSNMPISASSQCAVSYLGKIYIFGGDQNGAGGVYYNTVLEYDPSKE